MPVNITLRVNKINGQFTVPLLRSSLPCDIDTVECMYLHLWSLQQYDGFHFSETLSVGASHVSLLPCCLAKSTYPPNFGLGVLLVVVVSFPNVHTHMDYSHHSSEGIVFTTAFLLPMTYF